MRTAIWDSVGPAVPRTARPPVGYVLYTPSVEEVGTEYSVEGC